MYMLDTNTVSYFFRQVPVIVNRLNVAGYTQICVSSVTAAELIYGIEKRQNRQLRESVTLFLDTVPVYEWDLSVAITYGKLRNKMEINGRIMGDLDLMIASHALHLEHTLITNDKAFFMVPGLDVENWLTD
ncbi:type II toxin-antitoxin system VapC family toxin [Aggregatibacter actinomycetemcomitans]|uniref:type II toxin-antitoxin system VapC family toxin n=1 Tax=Aggregatibacter actinomycetemcomitans TaxID=714 RepID=UPI0011D9DFE4|nr:type II toxin-antitoxin system VapC family toxin [Aggregatibacter actinomycetemcomitans]QEH48053.1 type II toxin-antitoxin system VapC family toxin [Aggregatibacter actinomycetemcomitans]TYA49280.1 type II toxin-antitoxin system VapC family toxin [Aggregatibacter actinomycetemcomitans]